MRHIFKSTVSVMKYSRETILLSCVPFEAFRGWPQWYQPQPGDYKVAYPDKSCSWKFKGVFFKFTPTKH